MKKYILIVLAAAILISAGYIGYHIISSKKCDVVDGTYCFNYAKGCIPEGENLVDKHLTGLIAKCCDGLQSINPYDIVPDNLNDCAGHAINGNYGICSNCGDGICKSWENICNCPKDCR